MKVLLIEDDQHKSSQIIQFLKKEFDNINIVFKKSYQSGLKELLTTNNDMILLDMQLPNFDIKPGEDGYKFRKLAGLDILKEIKRKNIKNKVIVITQFETFGEGEYYIDLENLKGILYKDFKGIYIGTVYYSPENTMWQKELVLHIRGNND